MVAPKKPSRVVGRPSKLTDETKDKLFAALDMGASRKGAAIKAGIAEMTLAHWLSAGRENPRSKFGKLLREIEQHEAAVTTRVEARVYAGALRSVKDAQWWLQHRHASEWSERRLTQKVETSGPGGGPLRIETSISDDDFLARVMGALEDAKFQDARVAVSEALAAKVWPPKKVPTPAKLETPAAEPA
jgi:hypothetical protein